MAELEKLNTLAEHIDEEHRACETAVNSALTHAMTAGGMPSEAKGKLPHGAFGSDRTARACMRVHSRREEPEAKRQSPAALGLDGALRAPSTPKEAP